MRGKGEKRGVGMVSTQQTSVELQFSMTYPFVDKEIFKWGFIHYRIT